MSPDALVVLGREVLDRCVRRASAVEGQFRGVHVRLEWAEGPSLRAAGDSEGGGVRMPLQAARADSGPSVVASGAAGAVGLADVLEALVACDSRGVRFDVRPAASAGGHFEVTGAPFPVLEALFGDPGLRARFDDVALTPFTLGPRGLRCAIPAPVEAATLRIHLAVAVELVARLPRAIERSGSRARREQAPAAHRRRLVVSVLVALLLAVAICAAIALAPGR